MVLCVAIFLQRETATKRRSATRLVNNNKIEERTSHPECNRASPSGQRLFAGSRRLRGRFRVCCGGRRRQNPAERSHAEKAVPAWIAAVRREAEPALECDHRAGLHTLARNVLKIEIAAARAVRVQRKCGGHLPRVKPQLARHTAPWTRPCEAGDKIHHAPTVRPVTLSASAARTDHFALDASSRKTRELKLRSISKTTRPGKFDPKCPAMPPRVITATTCHSG
jgi:hypothetical protein